MSKKTDIQKAIAASEKEIEELEKKRNRSQSSILECFINKTEPTEMDKEYFRVYSQLIQLERENLKKLREELASM